MATKTKWKIAALVIVLALICLLPEVVSAGWHLRYGRSVVFRGWDVTLPFEWFAMKSADGMAVERMTRLPWNHGPVVVFLPVHFGKRYTFDAKVYARVQAETLLARGYRQIDDEHVQIAGEEGDCWKFVSVTRAGNYWISCIVPKEMTSVDFTGSGSYEKPFSEILSEIKREAPAR
ncbi:MAG TPA: hypothetical protein VJN21_05705 [Candidatus Acidoferrales bacterium]|nr:hypothetical protein [Candidatus Acidoferrales bacterium]